MGVKRGDRDWDKVIRSLNDSPFGVMTVQMGSPGSAQVTRVRLLQCFTNLKASTRGSALTLQLTHP